MSTSRTPRLFRWLAFALTLGATSGLHAQFAGNPDIRDLLPFFMIVVDSSGSMEFRPSCTCETLGCTECLPDCSLPNDSETNEPPILKKNRWAVALEVLTGRFKDYQCNVVPRTAANGATYDIGYAYPYHQPWHCPGGALTCAYPGTLEEPIQEADGLLDSWAEAFRFGLMTFDGKATYTGVGGRLLNDIEFKEDLSESQAGMWSYGGRKPFRYPGCEETYFIDTGVRSETATEGGLVSLNSTQCANPPCDNHEINDLIQDALLRTRPYEGTPIAAALEDLYTHYKDDLSDTFSMCRERYALLITDGLPDTDFREYGCDCVDEGECEGDPEDFFCPYALPEDIAHDLIAGRSPDPPQLTRLYVVGMSVADDPEIRAKLNLIAREGGSELGEDDNYALFSDDAQSLSAALSSIFSNSKDAVSRSVPAFVRSAMKGGPQYEINAGFRLGRGKIEGGLPPPWSGVLERKRYVCPTTGGDGVPPLAETVSDDDRFHEILNKRDTSRQLRTALPTDSDATLTGVLNADNMDSCVNGPSCMVPLAANDPLVTAEHLGLNPNDPMREVVLDWLHGEPHTIRAGRRLGDIFHSSPTILRRPAPDDAFDEAYAVFLGQPHVQSRPLTLFVGTNDGILHAFSIEAYTGTTPEKSYIAGEEMWGFVPPVLLPKLEQHLYSHQFGVDSTPVVKDVFFQRLFEEGTNPTYHTVLVSGLRGGGNAYFALDITDPTEPKFLWQFTDPKMGQTYGQPLLVQATVNWDDGQGTPRLQQRAVAILPGGVGVRGEGPDCVSHQVPTMRDANESPFTSHAAIDGEPLTHRLSVQCWQDIGRNLYFVDVETGRLIKEIYDVSGNKPIFPSPISGSPTAYQDAVGLLASRGFVVDADGVIWRIDLSDPEPRPDLPLEGWTVRPFHDIFWDAGPAQGETTYERPILSLDEDSRLVVIVGTGDTDNFEKMDAKNRVVSLTEVTTQAAPAEPEHFKAAFNWELSDRANTGLVTSELVTGSMALFQGELFFATFAPVVDESDACSTGRGRLWHVDYRQRDELRSNGQTFEPLRIPFPEPAGELTQVEKDELDEAQKRFAETIDTAPENLLVLGLGTTQLELCPTADSDEGLLDRAFIGKVRDYSMSTVPAVWLVAQASGVGQQGGSALGRIQHKLARQRMLTRVTSWASNVD